MVLRRVVIAIILALIATLSLTAQPRVFVLDGAVLKKNKENAGKLAPAIAVLEKAAKGRLEAGIYSVIRKSVTPPSGDKHDYMSHAPYFWPDSKTKDGLPYIRKDGERNPEIEKITDHKNLDEMIDSVDDLAMAYFYTGKEVYAARAANLLRGWFIEPATRMNPNLNFGQGIPGVTTGRGIGLIETRNLTTVVDSIGLLEGSKSLTAKDISGIKEWFAQFLAWMQESKNGRDEAAAKNNHGTYYDVQIVSFALFTGKTDLAKKVLEEARLKRIAMQIEPNGSQPLELERTKSWSYSVMNLDGLITLALLGDRAGVDLWNFETKDGRGIRKAIDYLYHFTAGEKWKHQQLGEFPPQIFYPVTRKAAGKYSDEKFKTMMARLPAVDTGSRENLVR